MYFQLCDCRRTFVISSMFWKVTAPGTILMFMFDDDAEKYGNSSPSGMPSAGPSSCLCECAVWRGGSAKGMRGCRSGMRVRNQFGFAPLHLFNNSSS